MVLASQPAWADAVQVSGVKLVNKAKGLEVILETVKTDSLELDQTNRVSTSSRDRTWVVDIANTQLNQPEPGNFQELLPAEGITSVRVQPHQGGIRVTVTGKDGVPTGEVSSTKEGIVLSLTPALADTQQQEQPNQAEEESLLQKLRQTNKEEATIPAVTAAASPQQQEAKASGEDSILQKLRQARIEAREQGSLIWGETSPASERQSVTASERPETPTSPRQSVRASERPETPKSPRNTQKPVKKPAPVSEIRGVSTKKDTLFNERKPASPVGNTAQAPKQVAPPSPRTTRPVEVPDYLNPDPNPLKFPTRPGEVQVQGTQPITLEQALELARRNNQDLQVAIFELERARATLREAQAGLFPEVNLQAGITRQQSAGQQLGVENQIRQQEQQPPQLRREIPGDQPSTTFSGAVQLSYDLYTSGRGAANRGAAAEQVRSAELEVERLSEQTRLDVATAYYNLQLADEQVRINQSAVRNAEASLRDAQALEQAGVGTRFDVLQSQVNLANALQELRTAQSDQQVGQRRLANLVSLAQSVNISAADPVALAGLWDLPLEESIVRAFANRAELQQALANRNASEQRRRLALSQLGPQISLNASYDLLDVFNDRISVADGYSLGVTARLALFDGGAARARAAQEKANINIAETNFANQRNRIRFDVEQAFYQLQSNRENVSTSELAVTQAEEALRLARLRFQAGVGTNTDVIRAENDLTRTQGNRVRAIIQYNQALVQLQRAVSTGGPR
jgi:OMF family outer membrane factor